MRSLFTIVTCTIVCSAPLGAQDNQGIRIHEKKTGITVALPADYTFAANKAGIIAVNSDKTAMVILAATDVRFSELAFGIETEIETRFFKNVNVLRAMIIMERNCGGLDGLVTAEGTAVARDTGDDLSFLALVVRIGDKGGLAVGAWKDPKHVAQLKAILDTLDVEKPVAGGGLKLTDSRTGASVKIPEGWEVIANRKGLFAYNPNRKAMTMIVRSRKNFDKKKEVARELLTQIVFKDVQIEEFAAVEAIHEKGMGQVVGASGSAKDRKDGSDVKFAVYAVERVDQNRGLLVVGAWKDQKHEDQVRGMLNTLDIPKLRNAKQKN